MRTPVLLGLAAFLATASVVGAGEEPLAREDVLRGLSAPDFPTRRDAVWAARDHPDPAYGERLLAMARRDPHPNIRGYALEALPRYEDPRVADVLLAAIAEETSIGPRESALEALGATRDPRAWEVLVGHLVLRSTGLAAMRGLVALGDPRAFEPVLSLWDANRDDPYVADGAPAVLVRIDLPRGLAVCIERFATAPAAHRPAIEPVLRSAGGPAVRAAMLSHLAAPDPALRHSAVRVLGEAGDEDTDRLLVSRFFEAPEDRAVLAQALGERRARAAVPALVDGLAAAVGAEGESAARTRAAVAAALGRIGDLAAVPALVNAFEGESDPIAAVETALALGRLGDGRASAALRAKIDDARVSRQPMTISSIWVWPWNVRVGDAALWALAAVTDGAAPFPFERLSGFPEPPDAAVRAQIEALRGRLREASR